MVSSVTLCIYVIDFKALRGVHGFHQAPWQKNGGNLSPGTQKQGPLPAERKDTALRALRASEKRFKGCVSFKSNKKEHQGEVAAVAKSQQGFERKEGNSCGQSVETDRVRLRSDGSKTFLPEGEGRMERDWRAGKVLAWGRSQGVRLQCL